jgi:hypothetical protein
MSKSSSATELEGMAAAHDLFRQGGPVLVEVRFPRAATSPDWYLCEEADDFDAVLEKLGPGAELYLSRVWDLTNRKGAVHVCK